MQKFSNWAGSAGSVFFTLVAFFFMLVPGQLVAEAYGSISGTVYESDGITPVTGDETIRIALFDHDYPHNPMLEVPVETSDGTYAFGELSAGDYDVRVLAQDYIDAYWTAEGSVFYRYQLETITLHEGEVLTGIDFQLTPGTALTGTVYATDGTTPMDDAGICAHVSSSCGTMWEFCSQTEPDGTYTIKLPSDTFFFQLFSGVYIAEWWAADASVRDCADAQPIAVSEGSSVSGIDFQVERGVTVSGTVYHEDGATPVAGDPLIEAGFVRNNPCISQGSDFGGPINTDGNFSYLVEPGTYYLNLSAQNFIDAFWASPESVYFCTDAQIITVEEDTPLTGVDFQLSAGNVISGTVYASEGTEPVKNQPYLGVEITTQNPCAIDYETSAEFFTFVDTSLGTWSVHVPDGTYYILLNTGSHDTNQFWAEPTSVGSMDCELAQALTVLGNNSYPETNFHVNPDDLSPADTVPTNPDLSLSVTEMTVNISWSADNADTYILYAAPYPDAAEIYDFDMGSQTSISFALPADSAFYVAVRASNAVGMSDWSNIEYFDLSQTTSPSSNCGAYVAPGVWKQFDCYNLAAIGKTTNDDPFTPSWRLIGGYWQWGRKGPDPSQWYNVNTERFAHGPTGPGDSEANDGSISGWSSSNAPNGAWSDASKTANDPCPAGFRVPTRAQWDGVRNNNTQSTVGTWSSNPTNYSSARFFGSDLILPAAGNRGDNRGGALHDRGNFGFYWSSSDLSSGGALYLFFGSGEDGTYGYSHRLGFSIRCILE